MTVRVVLVDDQDLVRAGFRMILEHREGLEVVGEAADGLEALRVVERTKPSVVVMDIRMPDMDGIQATQKVVSLYPDTKVVVLTTFDTDDNAYAAIRAGASGFLLKDTSADAFVYALLTVAAGDAVISPVTTKRMLDHIARTAPTRRPEHALAALSEREREVLTHVARGLTNTEIASTMYLGESTVKTHVSAILRKLALRDRVHAVITAYDAGIVAPGDDFANP